MFTLGKKFALAFAFAFAKFKWTLRRIEVNRFWRNVFWRNVVLTLFVCRTLGNDVRARSPNKLWWKVRMNVYYWFKACLHWQRPGPIPRSIEKWLYRIVWRCSHCSEALMPLGTAAIYWYLSRYQSRSLLGPVYTKRQRQRHDDACDSVLIENSGVTWKWVANPFWSESIVFNEKRIASIITLLMLTLGVNGPLVWTHHKACSHSILMLYGDLVSSLAVNLRFDCILIVNLWFYCNLAVNSRVYYIFCAYCRKQSGTTCL